MNKIHLSHKIISLPNKDKGSWNETYDEKEHGFHRLVHPFKALYVSKPNGGKTTVMINCFLQIQTSNRPFVTVIVIQPSTSSEWDVIDPTCILNDIPDPESLVCEDNGKTLLIIDDFDLTKLNRQQQQNFSMLFRYISSHHNISVMLSYQSFFDIPTIMRKTCNYFFIWKTANTDELNVIAKRVGYDKHVFKHLFKKYIHTKHDFLLIDTVLDNIRKNMYELIDKSEYDDY